MGRRKIEIQPLANERNRSVTFLKRKNGLFKKAYELGVLCSVDIAVIVFDQKPGHEPKVFEYCSGDTKQIISRYNRFAGDRDLKGPRDFDGSAPGDGADDEDVEAEGDDDPPPPEPENEPVPVPTPAPRRQGGDYPLLFADAKLSTLPDRPIIDPPPMAPSAAAALASGSGFRLGQERKKRRLAPTGANSSFFRAFDAAFDPDVEHPSLPPRMPEPSTFPGIPIDGPRWVPGGHSAVMGVGVMGDTTERGFDWPSFATTAAATAAAVRPAPDPRSDSWRLLQQRYMNAGHLHAYPASHSYPGPSRDNWLDLVTDGSFPGQGVPSSATRASPVAAASPPSTGVDNTIGIARRGGPSTIAARRARAASNSVAGAGAGSIPGSRPETGDGEPGG